MILLRTLHRSLFGLGATVALLVLAGCVGLPTGKPAGPWHEAYEPINDPASEAFVSNALQRAVAAFGDPVVPVNKVLLRRSKKTEAAKRYHIGEDFSLTECFDSSNGVFVIYLAVDPGHVNYYALLGHECTHLINPYITDWYMEGMATVFSQQICKQLGVKWGDWERHFNRSRRQPYALSYRMMLQLQEVFPRDYPLMINYTTPIKKRDEWLRIDIDAWLDSLAPARRLQALSIIEPYVKELNRNVGTQYAFQTPEALK
ncbi:hypothetical protein [Pontiella sulfatireligans]|uniref:Peptidase MA-like domain-containing protein n=1 Tax=Pontiella sulfatireligans TaxID=2750658 RepID=A0A6C2UR64_9BACT|nr:hypothetical protein [Pontiella sulfatireligans]VGO22728.1 hypothetical protein SCARR_04824 [Pontiella sulfatireligans]